jgi:hypothetical protein
VLGGGKRGAQPCAAAADHDDISPYDLHPAW